MDISTGKNLESRQEKIGKSDFPPENFPVTPLHVRVQVWIHLEGYPSAIRNAHLLLTTMLFMIFASGHNKLRL